MSDPYADLMREGDPARGGGPSPAPSGPVWRDPTASPSGLGETDLANAQRLARAFGESALYVIGKGWAVRDGMRYTFRGGDVAAFDMAAQLPALIRAEADQAAAAVPSEVEVKRFLGAELRKSRPAFATLEDAAKALRAARRKRWEDWARKCEMVGPIKAALEAARGRFLVDIEDLDADPWSLTVQNGRVDLRAVAGADLSGLEGPALADARRRWLKPQDWTARPTKCAGVAFDPAADCPKWRAFLELIQPDPEVRAFLKRCLGMLVFGRNDAQVCLLLRGGGGNGKSTLTDTVQHVLGSREGYAAACKVDMFLVTREAGPGQATPEEVDLPGARAYFASEPAATDTFSAKKIKALTGGDRRPVRGLNRDQFYYYPRGVPVISFNRTPRIKDEDEGTRRRLVFIPFDVELHKLPPERRRPRAEVDAELRAEGPGILNWLLDGFREFRRDGLAPPQRVADLKEDLMADADPVGGFLADCCERDPDGRVGVTELHRVFECWCEETGAHPWGAKALGAALVEKGLPKRKVSSWFWVGIRWKSDAFTDDLRARAAAAGDRPAAGSGGGRSERGTLSEADWAAFLGDSSPPF